MFSYIMTTIQKWFFGGVKLKQKKILERKHCFKHCFKRYWACKMEDGTIEFTAYDSRSTDSWYLGKYGGGKIVECDGFYNGFSHNGLDWDVVKGAQRIFTEQWRWRDLLEE